MAIAHALSCSSETVLLVDAAAASEPAQWGLLGKTLRQFKLTRVHLRRPSNTSAGAQGRADDGNASWLCTLSSRIKRMRFRNSCPHPRKIDQKKQEDEIMIMKSMSIAVAAAGLLAGTSMATFAQSDAQPSANKSEMRQNANPSDGSSAPPARSGNDVRGSTMNPQPNSDAQPSANKTGSQMNAAPSSGSSPPPVQGRSSTGVPNPHAAPNADAQPSQNKPNREMNSAPSSGSSPPPR